VRETTRLDYSSTLDEFYHFAAFHGLSLQGENELEEALCDFADELYLNGEDSHPGDKLRAALEFERPEAMRNGQLQLPRFKRAQKGWRKMAPTQARMPMVEFIKSSITGMLIHLEKKEMALFNEVTFSTYARPGEMFKIYPADVVPRNNTFHHDVIVLGAMERNESSKAGIFDETLILDDTRCPLLGTLMKDLAEKRVSENKEDQPLWGFSAQKFLQKWRACVQILEVQDVAHSPYQNRHGGASRDMLLKLRSVQAINQRGRWATDVSARIYSKPGKFQQIINQCSHRLEQFGEDVRRNFEVYHRSGRDPLPQALRKRVASCIDL